MTISESTTATTSTAAKTPSSAVLSAEQVPSVPDRILTRSELKVWAQELAQRPDLWQDYVAHGGGQRHFASLYRDSNIDVWLLCWDTSDDTGWHDHDISSGAVAVAQGAVTEANPRMGGEPVSRVVEAGRVFTFGPDHIHRMSGAVDGSVSIHAYSPPLWRMGQYAIGRNGVMRRKSVSYADELRPMDDVSVIENYRALQRDSSEIGESAE
ncbi:cysteine dioxygenase [Labedella phragmitis]|uniref:Cysteine dioxygenase n=1 Tax=Labedella phragmitis TaxID=2498849 RepID=A0A3S3Z6M8_9MICO|nr:cysteine dioxygenase family protein [Labedella phragmitis]RWZ52957.1 cysteine dioxygenase [Labedella phragmitis]